MDSSKELIAMCDCPEIQEGWEPKVGDRNIRRNEKAQRLGLSEFLQREELMTVGPAIVRKESIFLPSVSWLLRAIQQNLSLADNLCLTCWPHVTGDGKVSWKWTARIIGPIHKQAFHLVWESPPCNSPDKALMCVYKWQQE